MNYLSYKLDCKVMEAITELAERCEVTLLDDENVDSYSQIAAELFKLSYEDCCETKKGKPNIAGKKRRQIIKLAVLGIIAEKEYNKKLEEAEKEYNNLQALNELTK